MNDMQIFKNETFGSVRVVNKDGEPWFVAKDICDILEYANTSKAISDHTEENERYNISLERGGTQLVVNESGLYSLIIRSNKPEAKKIKVWVTSEVLPAIRKHGVYATDNMIEKMLNDPDSMIQALKALKEERSKRVEAEKKNAILMHVNKTYTATEVAKECGFKSAIALNKKLNEMKIQYKVNNTWVLYSKYADLGYEEIKQDVLDNGHVIYHRRFTQYGRDFILGLFNNK